MVVLAYSLLLGMGDFSARASNMHQCGLQLGELSRKLKFKIDNAEKVEESDYLNFTKDYYICLNRHENHIGHDYLIAKLDYIMESSNKELCSFDFLWFKMKILIFKLFSFSHYLVSIFLMIYWFVYILQF